MPHLARNAHARLLCAFLSLGCLEGSPLFGQETSAPPRWKVDVGLVRVLATVRDASGHRLANLTAEDFEIYEEGRRQRIAVFERSSNLPLQIALLLDASLSAAKEREFQTAAAVSFLRRALRPNDRAAIYRFARDVQEVVGYGSEWTRLERVIAGISPSGGTSLYDAIYLAAGAMDDPEARRAIVVISDGTDTTSRWRYADALRAAQQADAMIYSIAMIPIRSESGRQTGGEHALTSLAQETGGAYYSQHSATDLDAAFAKIEEDLRGQYLLGYYPATAGSEVKNTSPSRYVPIEVRMNNPSWIVRTRRGYYVQENSKE